MPWWELVIRSVVIYVVFLVALRIFGKREVGQFTLYDLVLILLAANAVQPAITGPDNSLTGGAIIVVVLVMLNYGVSRLDNFDFFHRLLRDSPTTIIEDGKYLTDVMKREGLIREDGETAIREHGLTDVAEVKLGVLEPDGNISIIGMDGGRGVTTRTKRRRRFLRRR